MIYLHNKYQYEMLQLNLKSDSWEYLFIKIINFDNLKNLILGNIYRPPKIAIIMTQFLY